MLKHEGFERIMFTEEDNSRIRSLVLPARLNAPVTLPESAKGILRVLDL